MAFESNSNTTAVSPSHFFSLPRELRDAIYELCLPDLLVIKMVRGKHPQWLLTSKQIFFEAAPMLYDQLCFYKTVDYENNPNLLEQLFMNYAGSSPTSTYRLTRTTFEHVKPMISYIAIDVHLEMAVDQVSWLTKHYFAGLDELTNLKALYISLNPRPGSCYQSFRRKLGRSDLRIFQVVLFVETVKLLFDRTPRGCRIYWSIPENIRRAANGGELESSYYERNVPDITDFMMEVNQAVLATEPQDGSATEQLVTQVDREVY